MNSSQGQIPCLNLAWVSFGKQKREILRERRRAAFALPANSHLNLEEIANLVAVELAYRRIDQGLDPPLAAGDGLPETTLK